MMQTFEESKENTDNDEQCVDEKKTNHSTNISNILIISLIDDLLSIFCVNRHKRTALFYHSDCLKHYAMDTKGNREEHVEQPQRCSLSYKMLKDYGLLTYLREIAAREANKNELVLSHSMRHIEMIIGSKHHGDYTGDTYYNSHSPRAAKLAAGATIDLMIGILQNEFNNGFALVRPPGHHCEHNKPMGFCLFNNVSVAVNCVRSKGLCKKILIVDWDVHHGNGTENVFYDDKDVLYFSVHRSDNGFFYPGTGKIKESGNGFNVNVPLNCPESKGHGDKEYILIWKDILLPICKEFTPDIVMISAGFDACIGDPLGKMRVTPPCFGLLTRLLLNVCSKIGIVLEGGYNLETMPRAICCCIYALLKGPTTQKNEYNVDEFYSEFKENIVAEDKCEIFDKWSNDYCKHLMDFNFVKYKQYVKRKNITENVKNEKDFSNYISCKNTIREVLNEQQKYWKCAAKIFSEKYVT